ncbi:MAG: hypothetical protein MHM6MM_007116 [Cercozoa sp. M6MM]
MSDSEDIIKLVVLGPPGAGKGTQCARIQERFHVLHVSTGQLLHREMQQGTELGEKVRPMVCNGRLVPDSLVNEIVKTQLSTEDDLLDRGWVLDGFPRTGEQASFLLRERKLQPDLVLLMRLSREKAAERIRHRVVDDCRKQVWSENYGPLRPPVGASVFIEEDDRNEEAITRRLDEFELHEQSVVKACRAAGVTVVTVDADRDVERVSEDVMGLIAEHFHQGLDDDAVFPDEEETEEEKDEGYPSGFPASNSTSKDTPITSSRTSRKKRNPLYEAAVDLAVGFGAVAVLGCAYFAFRSRGASSQQ